jgi:nickel-dependent lactate racemase
MKASFILHSVFNCKENNVFIVAGDVKTSKFKKKYILAKVGVDF